MFSEGIYSWKSLKSFLLCDMIISINGVRNPKYPYHIQRNETLKGNFGNKLKWIIQTWPWGYDIYGEKYILSYLCTQLPTRTEIVIFNINFGIPISLATHTKSTKINKISHYGSSDGIQQGIMKFISLAPCSTMQYRKFSDRDSVSTSTSRCRIIEAFLVYALKINGCHGRYC